MKIKQNSKAATSIKNWYFLPALLALIIFSAFMIKSTLAGANNAIQFDGSNDYVTFGNPAALGLSTFTIETWFIRQGTGVAVATSGTTNAIPLVTKGRGEADGDNRDLNYFLGIDSTTNVLFADFEEGAGATSPGLNHPVLGRTTICNGVWYHAAATYDGSKWQLFLNGELERELVVNQPPRSDSIQGAALGTALNSTNAAAGFFNGTLDEVRIWNFARSASQIRANLGIEISSDTGLVGRWGLNEGGGATISDSSGNGITGTLTNGPMWVAGTPFTLIANGLDLGGNTYVTFGAAPGLGASVFTLEGWIKREGTGVGASTGSGGLPNAVPIITKGRGEADGDNRDMNYFLGIDATSGVLVADFEDNATGGNHPVIGTTPLALNTWYHIAATYDGTTWQLYLNGNPDGNLNVGFTPRSDSIQHAAIGSALTSTGAASGFFDGIVDEVRIWNVARTQTDIFSNANSEIPTAPNLIGRWGFNQSCGTPVIGSAGTTPINGTITGVNSAWVAGSPFDISGNQAPMVNAGTDQTVTFPASASLNGTATDDGLPNPPATLTVTWSKISGPGTVNFGNPNAPNTTASFSASGVYVLRLTGDDSVLTAFDEVTVMVNPQTGNSSLDFGGTNAYVNFGNPAKLHLPTFTIETRFRRDGTGLTTTTGTGGVTMAIPLVTRGRGEAENANADTNYFLGIDATTNVLIADFEEGAGGTNPSQNHPIFGNTVITNGVWHHAAATYDGNKWQLYLDGVLESELVVGQPVAAAGNQLAAIATGLTTGGVAEGFFDGAIDEVRIWDNPLSAATIRANSNMNIPTASGLIARWGLDEAIGISVGDSTANPVNGTITNANWIWIDGSPIINLAPLVNAGADQNVTLPNNANLSGTVSDDGLPNPPNAVTTTWSQISGPGTTTFGNASSTTTTASFSIAGTYILRLTANDGVSIRSDDITITVTSSLATVTFREGVNGYNGTVDTYLRASQPTTAQGASATVEWDLDEGTGGGPQYSLIRFDNLFGAGAGQIPSGVFITSATLTYTVFDVGDAADVNEALVDWDETATFNNFGGETDVQPDEYGNFVDSAIGSAAGTHTIDVTNSLLAWYNNPANNRGWIFRPLAGDGVDFRSSESATVGERPLLTVTFSTIQPNRAPNAPVLISPSNGAIGVATNPTLNVDVSDDDGDNLTVTYYGRPASTTPAPNFTIIALPDTQFYSSSLNGGSPAIFNSQTQWIVDEKASRNIVFVTQLGDCVQNGDNGGNPVEWNAADAAISLLENPVTTNLPDGIPYGIAVGNHDQSPIGDPNGTTTFFNQYFGEARFLGRPYYGGHYGSNNDNHYQLFSASGMDFIIIHFEYDPAANPAVLAWADNLLQTHSNRRAILVSHHFVNTGNPASFGSQGQATYDALKGNPNLFLMLNGHVHGEGRRQDTFNGNTVNSLLSDYQGRTNGGDGWLRIMTFSPATNQIQVQTYSPWLNQFETDADSQFTLSYNMTGAGNNFSVIGTNSNVPGFTNNSITWNGLISSTEYEWYVTVSDGMRTTTGPIWRFTTLTPTSATEDIGGQIYMENGLPFADVTVNLVDTNGNITAVTTDAEGFYRFPSVPVGSNYIITPSRTGWTFSPANRLLFHEEANLNENFTTSRQNSPGNQNPNDFDGDGKTDLSVFRPSNSVWHTQLSANNSVSSVKWGLPSDLIAPADFDGDGRTDISVFRPSEGIWYRINSSNNTTSTAYLGLNGDKPVPSDFDGDRKADISIYRPSDGSWHRLNSSDGSYVVATFGLPEDVPTLGDFDGDSKTDLAVWRPSEGVWYRLNSSDGSFFAMSFGLFGDKPTPADYDGDGRTDISVFRPSDQIWYRLNSSTGQFVAIQWGLSDDIPVPGDYDGDGRADISVFRPSDGTWYLSKSTQGIQFAQFGSDGDKPIPAAYIP